MLVISAPTDKIIKNRVIGSYNLFQALQLAKTARSFEGELNISKFEVYVEMYMARVLTLVVLTKDSGMMTTTTELLSGNRLNCANGTRPFRTEFCHS